MNMEGFFIFDQGNPEERWVKNTIVAKGAEFFLRTLFRGETVLPATYYVGMTNSAYAFDTATLAAMAAGEPTNGGYVRQAANQDTTDWDVVVINNVYYAQSKSLVFPATADWNKVVSRAFLCDAETGTAGNVFAVSGADPLPKTILDGVGITLSYVLRLRG